MERDVRTLGHIKNANITTSTLPPTKDGMRNGDIVLYYNNGEPKLYVKIKNIVWFWNFDGRL